MLGGVAGGCLPRRRTAAWHLSLLRFCQQYGVLSLVVSRVAIMQYLRSAYNRRTNNVFGATPQFWERHADATLWWDLNYLHLAMCNSTKEVRWKQRSKFLKNFTSLLANHPSPQPAWQLATAAPSPNTEQFLVANMCNSAALLTFCIASTDSSRSNATAGFWLGLVLRILQAIV